MILRLFVIFTFLAIFTSGISRESILLSFLFSTLGTTLGLINLLKTVRKINIPRHFFIMVLFFLILQVYLFFIGDKLNPLYSSIVLGEGLIYWAIFYNLPEAFRYIKYFIYSLAIIYSLIYLASLAFNISLTKLAELYFGPSQLTSRHWHLGNLWAFVLVITIAANWGKYNLKNLPLIVLGIIFLVISNVRSAMVSLMASFIYLFYQKKTVAKMQKVTIIALALTAVIAFIYISRFKTSIFSRPYYIQSIESFAKYPLGVGVGNFKNIAIEYYKENPSDTSLSFYTHNVFLETLSGVGVFSMIPLIFLILLTKDLIRRRFDIIPSSLLIAMLVNFMIDASYLRIGLVWLFFMTLGTLRFQNTTSKT
jgi:hypothetical protein